MLSIKINKNNIIQTLFAVLAISLITHVDCHAEGKNKTGFERLSRDWHNESEEIRFSSRTEDYLKLHAFRKIVALGKKALPSLKEKLEKNEGDFILAHAVVQINGWNLAEFGNYFSEQELRNHVLKKMNQKE